MAKINPLEFIETYLKKKITTEKQKETIAKLGEGTQKTRNCQDLARAILSQKKPLKLIRDALALKFITQANINKELAKAFNQEEAKEIAKPLTTKGYTPEESLTDLPIAFDDEDLLSHT